MQKVTYLFMLFLTFSVLELKAQTVNEYIKFDIDHDLVVNARTDTTYELRSVEPSGDATSESAPAKVFVPIGDATKADYFLYKATNPSFGYIFDSAATNNSEVIRFPMRVKTLEEDRYLYVAIKDGTEYKMVKRFGSSTLSKNTTVDMLFEVSPFEMCSVIVSSTSSNCAGLTTVAGDTKTFLLYFYMSDSNYFAAGESVTAHAKKFGSMYYEVSMSSKINDSVNIDLTDVKKGDRRVTAFYKANSSILNAQSVRVFLRNSPSTDYNTVAGAGGGEIYYKEFPFAQESSLVINELQNDTNYLLSIGFVDKYNFVSRLSPTFDATPMAIEELLKKEACFLLTAGFGEEHYVIDYFRSFRDEILSKFYLGRLFITTYYDLAPKYALIIYENESIRSFIRALAYIGYFVFNNVTLIMGLGLILFSFAFKQKKHKKPLSD